MKHTKQAFTLTELLIALGIIGAIAAISIPSLMTSINNRILTNQLKSTVGAIQQLMNDEMVTKNTKAYKILILQHRQINRYTDRTFNTLFNYKSLQHK